MPSLGLSIFSEFALSDLSKTVSWASCKFSFVHIGENKGENEEISKENGKWVEPQWRFSVENESWKFLTVWDYCRWFWLADWFGDMISRNKTQFPSIFPFCWKCSVNDKYNLNKNLMFSVSNVNEAWGVESWLRLDNRFLFLALFHTEFYFSFFSIYLFN